MAKAKSSKVPSSSSVSPKRRSSKAADRPPEPTKTVATFLHVADIHLGFDRYDSPERTKDFFRTFRDVLLRYGVDAGVDFVLIAGDLFEHRNILPNVLNQAQIALAPLRDANIPVLAIEGNHDNRPYGVNTSWLRYLSQHGHLMLLEPYTSECGEFVLEPWSETARSGSYIDLPCGVRVIGSQWYGSSAPTAIASLAGAIANLPPGPTTTVLMFHHGLEGQIARYAGALRYQDIVPLREVGVNYLALGHIHKHYTLDNWVFNPGSLLANSMDEATFERGALLVSANSDSIQAKLKTDYEQRRCYRLKVEAKGSEQAEQLSAQIIECVERTELDTAEQAIVEVKVTGKLGCERYELNLKELQNHIQSMTNALIVLLKIEAEALQYDLAPNANESTEWLELETQVFTDLLAQHAHYRKRSGDLAKVLMGVKEMVGDGEPEDRLYGYLEQGLAGDLPEL